MDCEGMVGAINMTGSMFGEEQRNDMELKSMIDYLT